MTHSQSKSTPFNLSSSSSSSTISTTSNQIKSNHNHTNKSNSIIIPSVQDTLEDLSSLLSSFRKILPLRNQFTKLIPAHLRQLARWCVRLLATMLHSRNLLASNLAYDFTIVLLKLIINLFFREIRPRGSHKIPKKGPVIFVAAPHHNQFLDPIILMSEVRAAENARRVSFLIAEKSMKRPFIGLMARIMQSISVTRAADNAKDGTGSIFLLEQDLTIIHGSQTCFTNELSPRMQLMLSKQFGFATVEVVEVINNVQLRVKKAFTSKASDVLRDEGMKITSGNDTAGLTFKVLPYIDQTRMYSRVYEKLKNGGCLGIFPEGGSHDRTDLLPLKAGVSIMALGAMSANPEIKVRIVPVGLSYFHPHRFRSRAVVEFGSPIEIPQQLVRDFESGNEEKKAAIGKVMDLVYDGLKSVTIQTPDYDTLQVIQAARRLYRPPNRHVSLGTVVELNKRFITGYLRYQDEPRVQALKQKTLQYNKALSYLGLKDHQVDKVDRRWWKSLILLCFRAGLVTGWGVLALPGVVLNAPMFICASIISRKKAKEALAASTVKIAGRDVLATWKVLVSLGLAPPLYLMYVAIAVSLAVKYDLPRKYLMWTPLAMLIALPSIGYSALKFGEVGMDVYKSLRPLLLSLSGDRRQIERVRGMRTELQEELHGVIEEYAPKIWENFDQFRIHSPSAEVDPIGSPRRTKHLAHSRSATDLIHHPLSWLDERLFGWSQHDSLRRRRRSTGRGLWAGEEGEEEIATPSSVASGYSSEAGDDNEEDGDYDSVVGMLSRFTSGSGSGSGTPGVRSRRGSRASRSKSMVNLTELTTTSASTADSAKSSALGERAEVGDEGVRRTAAAGRK